MTQVAEWKTDSAALGAARLEYLQTSKGPTGKGHDFANGYSDSSDIAGADDKSVHIFLR